jgi:hypothetical protein
MKRIILLAIGMVAFACYSTASQAAISSLTVTKATISNSSGAIAVSGTIVCTAGASFQVVADILQVSGGKNGITSGFSILGTCSGGSDTWTAPQALVFGSIKTGIAEVLILAGDTAGGTLDQVFKPPVTPVP